MKKLFLMLCVLSLQNATAQIKNPFNHAVCNTKVHDSGYYMRNAEAFLAGKQAANAENFTAPYYVRVFIRIVREDDGTQAGCTIETAIQNFNEMNDQYVGHNICFQLVGIDFVNDSYLNNFNVESNLETVYPNYIRNNNLDVNGAMTIFIHFNFLNDTSSSGIAYGIPNNFLSIARWAVNSNSVHSIFGHEMGHCLGLYHTFEQYNGSQERVTRSIFHICYNCSVEGDLCCDTPADYADSQDETSISNCVYYGDSTNSCDELQYDPLTNNIMSYQPWECISFTSTALTTNQRTRIHATINDNTGPVFSRVSEDNYVLNNINASSNAIRVYTAKNDVTTGNGVTITHSVSSKAYYTAGSSITFSPGVQFIPGANGLAQATISGCN
jgi:Metallo-peptidase family M12B Reprolysin-like